MKRMKLLGYVLFSLLIGIAMVSCEGPMGPAGTAGADGIDGVDGTDGIDGLDGNANVQTYVFNNPEWQYSFYMNLYLTGIIDSTVMADDVILCYVQFTMYINSVYPVPGNMPNDQYYRSYASESGTYTIISYENDGTATPTASLKPLNWVKIVIISSSNVTSYDGNSVSPSKSGVSKKELLLEQIKEAGVDLDDYYDVCNYFGLQP